MRHWNMDMSAGRGRRWTPTTAAAAPAPASERKERPQFAWGAKGAVRDGVWLVCSVLVIVGMAWPAIAATHSINIDATNRQQITGWGIYTENRPDWSPAEDFNISRNPAACDALYGPNGMGANVLRMAFPPQCYISDGVLDTNMMNGMKAHVMAALNRGVDKWFVSLWTPPASMKDPATTAGTTDGTANVHLREDKEDEFVQYCADLVNWMKNNGVPLPHSFSLQNEPGWHPWYDGCTYSPAQYQRVTKMLRAKFDSSGLSAVLLNGADGAHEGDTMDKLGMNASRNGAFDTDATLRNAVGVISVHTYDLHNGLWNWYPNGLQDYYNASRDRAQESWMTEWEVVTHGDFRVTNEWDILRENIRHFNRDMSTLQFNAWVYWQTWYANSPTNLDHIKTFINGKTTINRNTSYYMFRRIWQNAPATGGTYMRQVTTTDPDLKGASFSNWHQDFSCFVNSTNGKMVLVVCNPTGTNKTLDIKGVVGSSATQYRYTSSQAASFNVDMTTVGTHSVSGGTIANASIAANSVNIFIATGTVDPVPPATPTGLAATAGDAQVTLTWNSASGATSYNVKRSTTSGSGYTTVASPSTTSYVNTGLTNGTTYYYVVSAVNTYGESSNSSQVSATPQPPPPVTPDATIAAGTATIDGTVDSAWSNATAYSITKVISGTVSSTSDLSGTWKGLWDSTNLYALIEITDDSKRNDSTNAWDDDSIELYLDGNNNKASSYDSNDRQYVFGWNDTAVVEGGGRSSTGVSFAKLDPSTTSYRIEAKVPWGTLGVTASSGKLIGIDMHANDDDDGAGRDGKKSWYATVDSSWQNPSLFATANLASGGGGSPPAAPTNLTATAGDGQVALSWTASSGATSYNVKRSTTSGSGYSTVASPTTTSYTNTGLTNGNTYYYVVSAVNSSGESANSSQVSATPMGGQVAAPTFTPAPGTYSSSQSVTISTATSGASIRYTTDGSNPTSTTGTIYSGPVSISSTTTLKAIAFKSGMTDSTVTSGTYTINSGSSTNLALSKPVTVSSTESASHAGSNAVDGSATTRWSSAFSDPQWIYVDLGSSYSISRVVLNWETAAGRDYQIQVSSNATSWTTIHSVTGNTTAGVKDYTGLSGSGRYVRMYGTARATSWGYSLYEFEVYGTSSGGTAPAAPTGLTATAGDGQVSLSWTASSGATSYNVKRSTTSGSGYTTIASPTTTSHTNTGLTNGTTYYYVVSAVNSSGESANSSQVSATPTAPAGTGNTHAGTWAGKGVFSNTATWKNLQQWANVASNSTYTASFWMKGSGKVTLILQYGGPDYAEITRQTFTATSSWTQYSIPSIATTGHSQILYRLVDGGGVAGTVYIDDCFLGASGGTNTLGNPGFESGDTVWTKEAGSPFTILQNP